MAGDSWASSQTSKTGRVNPMKDEGFRLEGFRQDPRGSRQPAVYFCRNERRLDCVHQLQGRNPQQEVQVNRSAGVFKGHAKALTNSIPALRCMLSCLVLRTARERADRVSIEH
ncbi:unnamed protein product [Prorocentrum cordatum]|uniref:Uncharacterized protein n=1 Tax=Prorocentrum cordatum TaxID=2364126 RepID=A0ABN9TXT7_9DINO|nr:unnamed protein product [Polarella glacialis]